MKRLLITPLLFIFWITALLNAQVPGTWLGSDVFIEDDNGNGMYLHPDITRQPNPLIVEKAQFEAFANELGVFLILRAIDDTGPGNGFVTANKLAVVGNDGLIRDFNGFSDNFTYSDLRIVADNERIFVFTVNMNSGNIRVRSTDLLIDGNAAEPVQVPTPSGWSDLASEDITTINSRITDILLDNELVHLVFEDGLEINEFVTTSTRVGYARYNTTTNDWEEARWITEGSGNLKYGYNPAVAVSGDRIFVVYLQNQGGPTASISRIRFREFNNGNWSSIVDLEERKNSDTNQTQFPHVKAAVHNNELFVVSTYFDYDDNVPNFATGWNFKSVR